MTVKELIEQLRGLDENLPVTATVIDNIDMFAYDFDVISAGKFQHRVLQGDGYVIVTGAELILTER